MYYTFSVVTHHSQQLLMVKAVSFSTLGVIYRLTDPALLFPSKKSFSAGASLSFSILLPPFLVHLLWHQSPRDKCLLFFRGHIHTVVCPRSSFWSRRLKEE